MSHTLGGFVGMAAGAPSLGDETSVGIKMRIDDGVPGLVHATLHMPGEDPVRLRRLGPRTIFEVPKSELQALFALLSAKGVSEDDMDREVLNALGLKRLTERTTAYLQECRDYTWGVS